MAYPPLYSLHFGKDENMANGLNPDVAAVRHTAADKSI
jgi:hypothetical protein